MRKKLINFVYIIEQMVKKRYNTVCEWSLISGGIVCTWK